MSNFCVDVIKLKKLMIENGFNTITQLSNKAEIDRNTLSKVLNSKILPSSDVMYKLVKCLKISPEEAGKIFFNQYLHTA